MIAAQFPDDYPPGVGNLVNPDAMVEDLPVEPESHKPYLSLLTRGAEEAPADEQAANPRSASVRLRAAERTRLSTATKGTHR